MRATRSAQGPIAARLVTKVKYSETLGVTSTAGILQQQIWRLNSIFDPNYSGTGHQPYGHDQLSQLYERYRVFKCKWRIRVMNRSSVDAQVTVTPSNHAISSSNSDLIAEFPRSVTKQLEYSTGSGLTFTGVATLPSLNGQTSAEYKGDDRFQALFGANPTELMYLTLSMYAPTSASVTASVAVTLVYYVECFDPKDLGQS